MRGLDIKQSAMFSYLSPEQRVPADHPLRRIRQITDQILKQMSATFSEIYSPLGRGSIPPEQLLRALLLQVPSMGEFLSRHFCCFGLLPLRCRRDFALCHRGLSIRVYHRCLRAPNTAQARNANIRPRR